MCFVFFQFQVLWLDCELAKKNLLVANVCEKFRRFLEIHFNAQWFLSPFSFILKKKTK
jgi:hypothetical protein